MLDARGAHRSLLWTWDMLPCRQAARACRRPRKGWFPAGCDSLSSSIHTLGPTDCGLAETKGASMARHALGVWGVVTGYSMTSALGHAALNRLDTTGRRAVAAANYKDLRADSKRAQDQLTWIPAHRPAETVTAELNVLKAQRYWLLTRECAEVSGKAAREFCQQFYKLNAEFASAQESQKLESRIADIATKLANTAAGTVMAEADPQASVLSKITGIGVDRVQTALTIFVALLIEIGSGFGMYVAFAYWRINDRAATRQAAAPLEVDAAPSPAALLSTETVASEIEVAPLPSTAGGAEEQA